MSGKNLFLVQSSFNSTDTAINKLKNLYSIGDDVVLMGDSVLKIDDLFFQSLDTIYVLENEMSNLGDNCTLSNVKIISYDQFSDLVLKHTRSISLK